MFCWRRWPLGAVVWRLIAPGTCRFDPRRLQRSFTPDTASDAQWVQMLSGLLADAGERQRLAEQAVQVRELYAPAAMQRRFIEALEAVAREATAS